MLRSMRELVQVLTVAWPCTPRFMQYIITDRVASPPHLKHLYTEKLAYMVRPACTVLSSHAVWSRRFTPRVFLAVQPHSFFVNDHAQSYANVVPAALTCEDSSQLRAVFGLPPRPGMVYCMFNQLYVRAVAVAGAVCQLVQEAAGTVSRRFAFPVVALGTKWSRSLLRRGCVS